ncbi:hypothetical protein K439DRAFT_1665294, partial [Ramaria rubella]
MAPPSSFLMNMEHPSLKTSPIRTSFGARARTVSSPVNVNEDTLINGSRRDTSHTPFPASSSRNHSEADGESSTRARRDSATGAYFSKTFSMSSPLNIFARRRKSTQTPPIRPPDSAMVDVIEIGPDPARREDSDANVNDEDAEREHLRAVAAQALGLGLGRDSSGTPEPDIADSDTDTPVADHQVSSPYISNPIPPMLPLAPSSLISLPNSYSRVSPSVLTNSVASSSDIIPPYPSTLSALKPYIQTSSSLYKYQAPSTFLAVSFNRRAKGWKLRYVVLTSPPPPKSTAHDFIPSAYSDLHRHPSDVLQLRADLLQVPNGEFMELPGTRHSHLHLFKNASPAPEELEIDRLEINEDSLVYAADLEVAGKRDVVKVGGRDARAHVASGGVSVKSNGSSWHSYMKYESETDVEMGRKMWLLKMTDGSEMHRWIRYIKTAVLVQRAERAGMAFQQPHSNSGVSSVRADLDIILSMRSQGLSGMTVPSGTATPPYSSSAYSHAETSTHPTHTSAHPPQKPANNNLPKSPSQTTTTPSTPNPRYAEHVGAAPSHTAASASLRAKTFPTPSSLNHALPTLKGLFLPIPSPTGSSFGNGGGSSSSPNGSTSRPGSRPSSPQHDNKKDIDPIADDNVSLGHRAAALLNLFRSSSRMSHNHDHHMSTLTSTTPVTLAPPVRTNGIGSPISPMLGADDTVRGKVSSPAPGPGHRSTFSVDWSMMNDGGANN